MKQNSKQVEAQLALNKLIQYAHQIKFDIINKSVLNEAEWGERHSHLATKASVAMTAVMDVCFEQHAPKVSRKQTKSIK